MLRPVVRKARMSDKPVLMEFIKGVWGGHDYIPRVWDDWMKDKSGEMFVVEADGVPVGMNRVRFLEDGSAWFEGVRVHPEFRGRGLATLLGENSMKVARERGASKFRLTSNSRNRSAHRQVARMGFLETARFSVYDPKPGARFRRQEGARVAGKDQLEMIISRVGSRPPGSASVVWDSFTAVGLHNEVVAKRVDSGDVLYNGGAVAILGWGGEGKDTWNQICYLQGEPEYAAQLVEHAFATRGPADWKLAYVPNGSPIVGALRRRGLRRSFSLILFERDPAKG